MKDLLAYVIFIFSSFLRRPLSVLILSVSLAMVSLIFEGSLVHFWQLNRDYQSLAVKIENIKKETAYFESQIEKVSEPNYLELEAVKRFDLVGKEDLIFLFSE